MLQGFRTIIYPSKDLHADKAFWTHTLGFEPYFDELYYVGFNVGGYELGLDPNGEAEGMSGPVIYWGVADIEAAVQEYKDKGLRLVTDIEEYGGDIKTARFKDNNGYMFGLIENPHFKADDEK